MAQTGGELLSNGMYRYKINGDIYYVPKDINGNTSLVAYAPGDGGRNNDAVNIESMCTGSNPPNCVFAIANESTDSHNILETGTQLITQSGGNIGNVVYASFSRAGLTGVKQGNQYLQNHPDASLSIIIADGNTDSITKYNFSQLRNNNVPIIIIQGNKTNGKTNHEIMIENGYNGFYLTTNRNSHSQTNSDMINYWLLYLIGLSENPTNNDCNYQLYQDGQKVDFSSARNLSLSHLDSYGKNELIGDQYTTTDFQLLEEAMAEINSSISTEDPVAAPDIPIKGAESLTASINLCVDEYNTTTETIHENVREETESTISYAQTIIDMDLYLKRELQDTLNETITNNTQTYRNITNNKLNYSYNDGHKLNLIVENGQVKEMKFKYTYNNREELNMNIDNILVGEIDKKYFDGVIVNENTVEITIKKEFFENLSLDDIKRLFFIGGKVE